MLENVISSRSLSLIGILGLLLLSSSCTKDDQLTTTTPTHNSEVLLSNGKALKKGESSIAEIAIGAGFSELVNALTYVDTELDVGLVNLFLNGKDQYTVFAPTNTAFHFLYQAAGVTAISDLPAQLVLDVLLYHVVEGRRGANSVLPKKNPKSIQTLLGVSFEVDALGKITAVGNSAEIVTPNISAANGVIHVIDTVILPINL